MAERDTDRPARRPTLHDVAKAAGVSFKTVSRVVNGEAGVSEERTHRVRAAVESLGYQPDYWARRLRIGAPTGAIGMVLFDLANPFAAELLRGAEEGAGGHDAFVFAASHTGEQKRELALISALVERQVDAIIVAPSASEEVRAALANAPMPIAILDQRVPGLSAVSVRSDHYGGARLATGHLADQGHRRVGFLGDDLRLFSASERRRGFVDELAARGLGVDESLIDNAQHSVDEWETIVRGMFERSDDPPTALVTAQNLVTLAATRALQRLGLRGRIAHVSFDDVEYADLLEPALTAVAQQPRRMGEEAAQILLEQVRSGKAEDVTKVVPCRLIERGSGELSPEPTPH